MITKQNLIDLITHLQSSHTFGPPCPDDCGKCEQCDMQFLNILIGCNDDLEYTYQTGDPSYMGSVYLYPHWATLSLMRDGYPSDYADDIIDQLEDLLPIDVSIPVE